ncbi:uncharacterized protein DEA37_0007811 [Paragonimus westermani]|uniref:FERM domain-containing protein n=1 Tax=Paragonimus westermani TaxID=34504 RepID=A0A5J4N7X5_9TREM|nr:uncharacterized protein DEA37_0007811 [Paragonimus westermani]
MFPVFLIEHRWEHIKDLTYSRKTFTIQMLKKNKSVHFVFEDLENARYLWQFCIQMHSCYIEYWTRIKCVPPSIHNFRILCPLLISCSSLLAIPVTAAVILCSSP